MVGNARNKRPSRSPSGASSTATDHALQRPRRMSAEEVLDVAVALSERMSANRDQDNAAIHAAVKEQVAEDVVKITGLERSLNKAMKEELLAQAAR
eukprot:contig_8138_g1904